MRKLAPTAVLFLLVLVTMAGCLSFMRPEAHQPTTRSIAVSDSYEIAYRKALRALASMGADITSQDMTGGTISAKIHNAVLMNVVLSKTSDAGTLIEATGLLMPDKIVIGTFTEVDDFIRGYQGLR